MATHKSISVAAQREAAAATRAVARSSKQCSIYFQTKGNDCDLELKITRSCDNIRAIFFDLDNTLIPTRLGDKKACNKFVVFAILFQVLSVQAKLVARCTLNAGDLPVMKKKKTIKIIADILETHYGFARDEATNASQNFLTAFRRCPDNVQTTLDAWRIHLWLEALPNHSKNLAEIIYRLWLDIRYNYLALCSEYKDLLCCLRQLNYRLALITNGTSNAQWEKIKRLHLQNYFDYILISAEVPWEKPHPNIFYAACKFLQVKPSECAMIGDKLETDILGGHKAGLGVTFWLLSVKTESTNRQRNVENKELIENKRSFTLRDLLDLYKYFNLRQQNQKHLDTST